MSKLGNKENINGSQEATYYFVDFTFILRLTNIPSYSLSYFHLINLENIFIVPLFDKFKQTNLILIIIIHYKKNRGREVGSEKVFEKVICF